MRTLLEKRQWQACLLAFLIVRIASVWNRPIVRFPDTIGYERLDFLGHADRFWPVTLVYWLVSNDTARVAVQLGMQVLAFGFLATSVVALCGKRIWTGLPILVLACAPQITRFDLTILSESLGLSYLAATLGGVLWLLRRPSAPSRAVTIASLVALAMTRPPQMMFLLLACLFAVVMAFRNATRRNIYVAATLATLSVWGLVQLNNNTPIRTLVFYTMLDNRVVGNAKATKWFVDNGMPLSDETGSYLGYSYSDILTPSPTSAGFVYPTDLSPELLQYLELPNGQMPPTLMKTGGFELAEWVKSEGWTTYAKYVLSNPGDSWSIVAERADYMLNPPDKYLLPLQPRVVMPHVAFGDFQWWLLASLICVVSAALYVGWSRVHTFLVAAFVACFVWFVSVVHTSGIEHSRHAISVSVAIRLLAIVTIVYTITNMKDPRARNA